MFYLLFFTLLSFCPIAFAQYVDRDVWDVREQSFLNIKKMISNNRRKRVALDTSDIRLPVKRGKDIETCYDAFLKKQKSEIFEKIDRKFGINPSRINIRKGIASDCSATVGCSPQKKRKLSNRGKKPSKEILQKARTVFALFHKVPEDIPVVEESDSDDNPAFSTNLKIKVHEKEMKKYDEDAQSFIFAHEVLHLLENHATEELEIENLLKEKYGKLTSTMRRYILELSRCNETIADVKGALRGGADFIDGYIKFVKDCITTDEKGSLTTHPQYNLRLKQAELLSKEFNLLNNCTSASQS